MYPAVFIVITMVIQDICLAKRIMSLFSPRPQSLPPAQSLPRSSHADSLLKSQNMSKCTIYRG